MEQNLSRDETIKKYLEELEEKFTVDVYKRNDRKYYLTTSTKEAPDMVRYIFKNFHARISIYTGIDTEKGIEIIYHLAFERLNCFFNVRTYVDKKNPEIESVGKDIKGGEWIEREIHELFGVNFIGHPNLEHLLLRPDWPEGEYPLRKDYPVE